MPDFEEDIEEAILCLKIVKDKPNVVKNEDPLSPKTTSPVLVTLNLVVPDEEAAIMSPLFN